MLNKIVNEKLLHYESILTNENEWSKHSFNTLNYYHKEFMALVTYLDNKEYQMSENDKNELSDKIDTYMVKNKRNTINYNTIKSLLSGIYNSINFQALIILERV